MKTFSLLIFITLSFHLFSQTIPKSTKFPFEKWDKTLLEQANTAKNIPYLTGVEKDVIFICNLARLNGKLFSETYLQYWADSAKYNCNSSYFLSLKVELQNLASLQVFNSDKILYQEANKHALTMGKSGKVGHGDFKKRMNPMLKTFSSVAENCDYGSKAAIDIVMRLLIDEGIENLGHRKNLFNPKLNFVGVSLQKHKVYGINCVMDFGGK